MVFEFHEQVRRLASREERIESVASRACRNVHRGKLRAQHQERVGVKSVTSRAC